MIERAAIAGRARARRRAAEAVLAGIPEAQLTELERLLASRSGTRPTPFGWLKAMPVAPKADHVRELLDRLRQVRAIGLPAEATAARARGAAAAVRARGLRRRTPTSSRATSARRRRAILAATVLDLEARLTDAVLDMADRLIGGPVRPGTQHRAPPLAPAPATSVG